MAPVTCGITHRHKQRFLLRSGICQGLAAPLLPPYRVTGMLSQVWRRRPAEVISSPIYFNIHNISQLVLIKSQIAKYLSLKYLYRKWLTANPIRKSQIANQKYFIRTVIFIFSP
jgi:hypothetical protein